MKTKHLLYIFLIIAITPIVTNYILTREIICNYDVAGTGVDWINFYGSFLGSALSAFIAYYILLKTLENTNKENRKKYLKEDYDRLCDDLSSRIAQIEVMEVYRVLYYPKDFNIKEEMDRLTSLLFYYKEKANSTTLRYGLESDEDCLDFYNEYNKLIVEICNSCSELIAILSKYKNIDNVKLSPEERKKIQNVFEKEIFEQREIMSRVNAMPYVVFEKAKRYCRRKKLEVDKLYS